MNILAGLEHDPRFARALQAIHDHDQETTMTTPSQPQAAVTAAQPAASKARTWTQAVHNAVTHVSTVRASLARDLSGILHGDVMSKLTSIEHAAEHAIALVEPVIANPALDEAVEALLRADGAGVAAEVFDGVTDMLRAAIDRKAGTGPQAVQAVQLDTPGQAGVATTTLTPETPASGGTSANGTAQ